MLLYYAPAGALQGADLREKEITKSSANMAVHITEGLQITAETHIKVYMIYMHIKVFMIYIHIKVNMIYMHMYII